MQRAKCTWPHFFWIVILLPILCSCENPSKNKGGEIPRKERLKFDQYMVEGRRLYLNHCSNCHQENGMGLGKLYPPLNGSDYLDKNFDQVLCIMRYGLQGEIIVNGVTYNQPMPGVPTLTNLEIAEIATFIYNSWENEHGLIPLDTVRVIMEKCKQ